MYRNYHMYVKLSIFQYVNVWMTLQWVSIGSKWPSSDCNSFIHCKYFLGSSVCISNGSLNVIWLNVNHVICFFFLFVTHVHVSVPSLAKKIGKRLNCPAVNIIAWVIITQLLLVLKADDCIHEHYCVGDHYPTIVSVKSWWLYTRTLLRGWSLPNYC